MTTQTHIGALERMPVAAVREPVECPSPTVPVLSLVGGPYGTRSLTDPHDTEDSAQSLDRAARRARARRRRVNERALRRRWEIAPDSEAGMATAEYAIATLAAVGFAALLVAVLSSGEVKGLLMSLITSALNFG
ncbi:DUF4244 domain-containing protein [Arthrobacter echini]|uniref:DUF4244 domain-containing protein n=1 Tax=Arthrobacter echini TaxID=1529066 RepID=UPI001FEC91A3|nr:DUF4244 domain-containing protein [Arthrobacter echini]